MRIGRYTSQHGKRYQGLQDGANLRKAAFQDQATSSQIWHHAGRRIEGRDPTGAVSHEIQMTTIYGLFARNGRCLYVGRTKNPKMRDACHRNLLMKGRKYAFKPLRKVVDAIASKAEANAIREYRSKGQAKLNKHGAEPTFTHKVSLTLPDEIEARLAPLIASGMKKAVVITQALDSHLPKAKRIRKSK